MTTISTYDQQAIDFLNLTTTQFISEFEKFDFHSFDDNQKRNIFKITLKNSKHKYCFSFGSSLNDSLKNSKDVIYENEIDFYCGLKFQSLKKEYLSYSDKISVKTFKEAFENNSITKLINREKATDIYNEFKKSNINKYQPTVNILSLNEWLEKLTTAIIRKAAELKAKNFGEEIQNEEIIHPTAYSVLACLTKYEVGTFRNFCSDFGYDEDSRKAYKTYKAVLKEWKNIELLFTPEEIELLQEIN